MLGVGCLLFVDLSYLCPVKRVVCVVLVVVECCRMRVGCWLLRVRRCCFLFVIVWWQLFVVCRGLLRTGSCIDVRYLVCCSLIVFRCA